MRCDFYVASVAVVLFALFIALVVGLPS